LDELMERLYEHARNRAATLSDEKDAELLAHDARAFAEAALAAIRQPPKLETTAEERERVAAWAGDVSWFPNAEVRALLRDVAKLIAHVTGLLSATKEEALALLDAEATPVNYPKPLFSSEDRDRESPGTDSASNAAPLQSGPATSGQERIVRAAVMVGEAVYSVAPPGRHGAVFQILPPTSDDKLEDQGFLTSTGRFVTRSEALRIATTAGQIIHQSSGPNPTELFTEDMW
jgi:hypothetical protein